MDICIKINLGKHEITFALGWAKGSILTIVILVNCDTSFRNCCNVV